MFTCCHIEIEAADQPFHLTQSQYTDTGPTSPSADTIIPGARQGSHWSANFEITGMTPKKSLRKRDSNPGSSAVEADALTTRPTRRYANVQTLEIWANVWRGLARSTAEMQLMGKPCGVEALAGLSQSANMHGCQAASWSPFTLDRLVGQVVKASASGAEDPGFESRLRGDFSGSSHTNDFKWVLQWLPCQAPGGIVSALGLVGPVSVYCDCVR